jgi:hypothetical protein
MVEGMGVEPHVVTADSEEEDKATEKPSTTRKP